MATRLIKRGAKIDYVNSDGNTALKICLQNKLIEQAKFLLANGANPHIMDLYGKDGCDWAAENNLLDIEGLEELYHCSFKKKIIPILPDGSYP
jgi:ankyrin repeat protein